MKNSFPSVAGIRFTKVILSWCALAASVNVWAQTGPDLIVDADRMKNTVFFEPRALSEESCAFQEGCTTGSGIRLLMRFDVATVNIGSADIVLGDPAENPELYQFSPCHGHYHFSQFATYELLKKVKGKLQNVRLGRKQAFCLMDSQQYVGTGGSPKYTCSYQGISAGWADVYGSSLDCQWLDVTDLPGGTYYLRVTVDPDDLFAELDESNNVATVEVTIPGPKRGNGRP